MIHSPLPSSVVAGGISRSRQSSMIHSPLPSSVVAGGISRSRQSSMIHSPLPSSVVAGGISYSREFSMIHSPLPSSVVAGGISYSRQFSTAHTVIHSEEVSQEVVQELNILHQSFLGLVSDVQTEIESEVEKGRLGIKAVTRHLQQERAFRVFSLDSVQTTDELFTAIHPHHHFLNCYLIVSIALHFLSGVTAEKATEYKDKVVRFMKTTKIRYFQNTLKHYHHVCSMHSSPNTVIELSVPDYWDQQNVWLVTMLVKTLFPVKHPDELPWYDIVPGSKRMTFTGFEHSMTPSPIESSRKKTEFTSISLMQTKSKDQFSLEDTVRDLSCKVSVSSPFIDRWEYGLSIDIDPSSLHPSSRYVAIIKVYSEPDQFSFPMGCEPLSAVYSISLEGDPLSTAIAPPPMVLKIMHFADPDDVEQLNQLTFAKMSDHSQSQFEIVPGGSFKTGNRFGEIRLHHTCLWSIVKKIINLFTVNTQDPPPPPLYRGVVLYTQTSRSRWIMHLLVSRHKYKQMIALDEYMKNEYGLLPVKREPGFLFKFKESKKLEITTKEEMDSNWTISINGWTIAFDTNEISQETADCFQKAYHTPGHCILKIEKQDGDRPLKEQPMVELSGIDSAKKYIRIDPPIRAKSITGRTSSQDIGSDELQQQKSHGVGLNLVDVLDSVINKVTDWSSLGLALGLPYYEINRIRRDGFDERDKLTRTVSMWLESGTNTSWEGLVEALRRPSVDELALASRIAEKYL